MIPRIVLLILLAATLSMGCASGETRDQRAKAIGPTWIGAEVQSPVVSIPTIDVDREKLVHFRIAMQDASEAFMAYRLGTDTYVRANICPPCRSVGFSLLGDTLVCNTCGTKFDATTGKGISGACMNYPKAEVAHVVSGEKMTMVVDDLVTAYQNTQRPGWP